MSNNRKLSRTLKEILGKRGPHYMPLLHDPTSGNSLKEGQYQDEDGILFLLGEEQRATVDAQATARSQERATKGWQAPTPEAFRRLPQTGLPGWPVNYWQNRSFCTAEMWRLLEKIRIEEDRLPIGPMGNALDLSDGMGWLGYGLDVSGYITVVISEDTTNYGLRAYNNTRYLRIQADLTNPPLSGSKFDLVVFSFSLEMLDKPQDAVQNAARLLKVGGTLIIMSDQIEQSTLASAETTLQADKTLTVRRQKVGAMGGKVTRVMKNLVGGAPDVPPLLIARRQS